MRMRPDIDGLAGLEKCRSHAVEKMNGPTSLRLAVGKARQASKLPISDVRGMINSSTWSAAA